VWDNIPDEISNASSSPVVSFCDVKGGHTGTGNIDTDPLFADISGPDPNLWDLRLQPTSPCIDAGDDSSLPADTADLDNDGNTAEPIPYDLDDRDRIVDGDCNDTLIVDMGAYEFTSAYYGDFDGQCDVDWVDYAVFALAWLSEQGQGRYNADCDIQR
jgi:hypothetical protein